MICTYLFIDIIESKRIQNSTASETESNEIPAFSKIDNFACQDSYGRYERRKDADSACALDPNCQFVQTAQCQDSRDYGHFNLCPYDSGLIFSTQSCVHKKPDTIRSGNIIFLYQCQE